MSREFFPIDEFVVDVAKDAIEWERVWSFLAKWAQFGVEFIRATCSGIRCGYGTGDIDDVIQSFWLQRLPRLAVLYGLRDKQSLSKLLYRAGKNFAQSTRNAQSVERRRNKSTSKVRRIHRECDSLCKSKTDRCNDGRKSETDRRNDGRLLADEGETTEPSIPIIENQLRTAAMRLVPEARSCLDRMPSEDRDCYQLVFVERMTLRKASTVLFGTETKFKTVKNRADRAFGNLIRHLRSCMKHEFDDLSDQGWLLCVESRTCSPAPSGFRDQSDSTCDANYVHERIAIELSHSACFPGEPVARQTDSLAPSDFN